MNWQYKEESNNGHKSQKYEETVTNWQYKEESNNGHKSQNEDKQHQKHTSEK